VLTLERLVGIFAYRINHCCENHVGHTNTPCSKYRVFVVKPGRIYWPQGSKRLSMSPGSILAKLLLFLTEDFCGYLESLHVKTGIDWHTLKEAQQPTSQSIRNYLLWLSFHIISLSLSLTHTHTYIYIYIYIPIFLDYRLFFLNVTYLYFMWYVSSTW